MKTTRAIYPNKELGYINEKTLAGLIQEDIDRGVYDVFEVLKSRMQFIANKLIKMHYSSDGELSNSESKTLVENDYIEQY